VDKKKIGAGFAGALQKAADAAKLAKLTVQDMTADAKQSRGKKAQQKADAQKVPASKDEPTAVEPPENAAPEIPCIVTRNALQIIYYLMAADGTVYHSEEEKSKGNGSGHFCPDCRGIPLENHFNSAYDGSKQPQGGTEREDHH